MQTTSSDFAKNLFLTSLALVVFTASPVLAKDSDAVDQKPMALTDNPSADLAASSAAAQSSAPTLSLGNSGSASDTLSSFGPSSGTLVGNRALELRDEVLRLRSSVNLNSNQFAVLRSGGAAGAVQYHSTVAAITARLQNGTTRGNPILMRQWDEANNSLDEVTSSLNRLNSLLTAVDSDASVGSYLLQSVQAAFELSGAVDEDHDQLKLLRDEVSRQIVQLDYLRSQTTNDIERQTNYLNTERANLQALAFAISRGEMLGNSLANRPVIVTQPSTSFVPGPSAGGEPQMFSAPSAPVSAGVVGRASPMSPRDLMAERAQSNAVAANESTSSVGHLLVLIRYNQPVVEYQQQLSRAVGATIEHHPDATFSIVAVSPASGDPADLARTQEAAKRDAEDVRRSLVQLGLSPSHISVSNTQMQAAQVPEVHLYVR